jgi:hypothetical protein
MQNKINRSSMILMIKNKWLKLKEWSINEVLYAYKSQFSNKGKVNVEWNKTDIKIKASLKRISQKIM